MMYWHDGAGKPHRGGPALQSEAVGGKGIEDLIKRLPPSPPLFSTALHRA